MALEPLITVAAIARNNSQVQAIINKVYVVWGEVIYLLKVLTILLIMEFNLFLR